jgi:hypothetical protein
MGRKPAGGHVRELGGHAQYRSIRVMVDGKSKQVLEHRHVMAKHLGRPLLRTEVVHHIDGDGLNNDVSNLQIMSQRDHQRLHMMESGPRLYPIAEAIRLREDGWTTTAIAKRFNVGAHNILMAFKARGISTKDLRHGHNKWDVDGAKRLFDEGQSILQISRSVGVKPPSVRKAFIKRGWVPDKAAA